MRSMDSSSRSKVDEKAVMQPQECSDLVAEMGNAGVSGSEKDIPVRAGIPEADSHGANSLTFCHLR